MRTAIAAMILTAAAGAAHAEQIVAKQPDTVLSFFQSEGFPATMEVDSYGDPLIDVRYYGTNFSVYFYGCQQGKDCTSIQFFSGYRMDGGFTVDQANDWNSEKRFARAYVSDEGSARIEMDLYLGEVGLSAETFDGNLSLWLKTITDFEELIDW